MSRAHFMAFSIAEIEFPCEDTCRRNVGELLLRPIEDLLIRIQAVVTTVENSMLRRVRRLVI
jgi:hypothetical protein